MNKKDLKPKRLQVFFAAHPPPNAPAPRKPSPVGDGGPLAVDEVAPPFRILPNLRHTVGEGLPRPPAIFVTKHILWHTVWRGLAPAVLRPRKAPLAGEPFLFGRAQRPAPTTLSVSLRSTAFSLRLGHAAGLTPHRGVIQHRVAASLPGWRAKCRWVWRM